jgi:CheY-like chemotaxis protein
MNAAEDSDTQPLPEDERLAAIARSEPFLALLSHELRTPTSSIMLWAKMLQQMQLAPEQRQEGLAVIERSAQAQARLLDDVLDLARFASGKLRLDLRPTALEPLVREAIAEITPQAAAKGIAIATAIEGDLGDVNVDAERLRRVAASLLANALKRTSSAGRIRVRALRQSGGVEVSVAHEGSGIDPAALPRVFDQLGRAHDGPGQRGFGLSMAAAQRLVEAHGGSIVARSDGPDRGAEIRLFLPLAGASARAGAAPATAGEPSADTALVGRRVLLVEDDPQSRAALAMLLREAGAEVVDVAWAETAFAELERQRPDLVISDLSLPQEDGCALLRRVRAAETAKGARPVPAIALTGMARGKDEQEALRAGFQRHLAKPLTPEQLFQAIAEVLGGAARAS